MQVQDRLNSIKNQFEPSSDMPGASCRLCPVRSYTYEWGNDLGIFDDVPLAPLDSIFQLTASYKADTYDKKVNLGVGAYR